MTYWTRRNLASGLALLAALGAMAPASFAQDLPEGATVQAVENTKGPIRIAFMAFQNNPFWMPVTAGADAAKEYLAGHDVTVDYIDLGDALTAEAVVAGIESAVAQDYDGIVTVPIFDGTERAINEAVASGVPVLNIIAEGNVESDRIQFIGQDAKAAGRQIGEFISERMGCEGQLGVITGYFGAVQHNDRMTGATEYLAEACPNIEIVGPFENQDKAELAYSQVQDMMTANPDLKMVYVTAGGPFGAARAVQDLQLTGTVGVVGFDHTPENMAYLESGEMVGLLDQAPFTQAFDGTVTLYNYLVTGEAPSEEVRPVEGNLLTSTN